MPAYGVEACLHRPPEASIKEFLEGVRDGWNAGAMGSKALEVTNTMSWMGRQSVKRLLRDVSSDLVPCREDSRNVEVSLSAMSSGESNAFGIVPCILS